MLDMLALHNTSAARTGFQEPFGSLTLGAQTDQTMLATSIICVHMISYVGIFWTILKNKLKQNSQVGLDLQNGFVFFGVFFRRLVYILNNFTKWFCFFFRKKMKNTFFWRNTTKWFTTYFWIGPQIGVGFTKWFWFFSKNNEQIYKMVCSFFWKC
jgi:hypothetical protein